MNNRKESQEDNVENTPDLKNQDNETENSPDLQDNTEENVTDLQDNTEENSPDLQDNIEENIPDKENEITAELVEEFRKEISFDKEEQAASDEELYLRMKRRIIRSYRWQEDLIIPFSRELKITPEELEEILMKRLDMASLEALHPRFESSRYRCTKERVHSDLKLCWVSDVMNLLTDEEAEDIKNRITTKIVQDNEPYEKALEEGRREMVEYLKR